MVEWKVYPIMLLVQNSEIWAFLCVYKIEMDFSWLILIYKCDMNEN